MNNLNNVSSNINSFIDPIQSNEVQNPLQQDSLNEIAGPVFENIADSQKRKAPDNENEELEPLSKKRKISTESEKEEITTLLDEWVKEGQPEELRSEAQTRIMDYLLPDIQKKNLSLNDLRLSDLPDIFGYSILSQIGMLDLSDNQLTAVPDGIANLSFLVDLNLSNNQLTELPDIIENLSNLDGLDVSGNQLTELPDSIENLSNLKFFDLSGNQFMAVTDGIGKLVQLLGLFLSHNPLTTLPESIGSLGNLRTLFLAYNRSLIGLPDTVLNLPSNCTVELENTGLSEAVRTRLREISTAEGYTGPNFSISMPEHAQEEDKKLRELLPELYALIQKEETALPDLESKLNEETLTLWLNRIAYIGDYKAGGNAQKALIENTLSFIEKAYKDEEFAKVFSVVIDGASETCGDRMALSIIHLGVAYQLSQLDSSDLPKLGEFLVNTVWVIEILEECARNKIPELRFFDEIEVYLGYIIKLKGEDRLNLPIPVNEMLYFDCSSLTEEDLSIAEEIVKEKLASDEKYDYLIKNDKWKEALEANCPAEMEQIDEARYADFEKNPEDAVGVQARYEEALIALSKQVYLN